jgi:hypothetical protein
MSGNNKYTLITGDVLATTDKAVLVGVEAIKGSVWIPRQVIEDGDSVEACDGCDLHIETWYVARENLEGDKPE